MILSGNIFVTLNNVLMYIIVLPIFSTINWDKTIIVYQLL